MTHISLRQPLPIHFSRILVGRHEIELPTSKQVIASRLNLTPETLSRIFHDLTAAKLISVHGKHVTVHGVKKLREYEP